VDGLAEELPVPVEGRVVDLFAAPEVLLVDCQLFPCRCSQPPLLFLWYTFPLLSVNTLLGCCFADAPLLPPDTPADGFEILGFTPARLFP
jgi:hypothetical protein